MVQHRHSMRKRRVIDLGMCVDKMAENCRKLFGMPNIPTFARAADRVDNHLAYGRAAGRLAEKVLAIGCCGNVGNVLVLSERSHLIFRQSAQGKTIFERDHGGFIWNESVPCQRRGR